MKLFHYSHLDDQVGIYEGSWKSNDKPGLGACLRLGKVYPEAMNFFAVFCHLSPLPESWINNSDFPDTWQRFLNNMGKLLLEINVDDKDPDIFVVDRAHMEGFLMGKKEIQERYFHLTREEAEKAYFDSKVPLKEFLEKKNELGYSLPEVVVTHDIPIEDIRISDEQPLLDWRFCRERFRRMAEGIPALNEWYKKHNQDAGHNTKERYS